MDSSNFTMTRSQLLCHRACTLYMFFSDLISSTQPQQSQAKSQQSDLTLPYLWMQRGHETGPSYRSSSTIANLWPIEICNFSAACWCHNSTRMLASSLYVFTQYWSHWSTFTNLTKYGMQALSGYWEGFKNKHLGGGCKKLKGCPNILLFDILVVGVNCMFHLISAYQHSKK